LTSLNYLDRLHNDWSMFIFSQRNALSRHPVGGRSHIKRTRVLVGEPLTGTKILFCGRGLKFLFTPNKRHHIISCHIFFRLNALKGGPKAPAEELSRLNILRGTKNCCSNPWKVRQAAPSFLYERPSPRPPPSPRGGASTYEILNSAVIMNTLVCTFAVDSDQGLK